MRNVIGLSLIGAVFAQGESFGPATSRECWLDEGAEWRKCRDIFYRHCDEYLLYSESSCNVFLFSQSEIKWFSSDIRAVYWTYYDAVAASENEGEDADDNGDDFGDFGDFKAKLKQESIFNNVDEECELGSSIPEQYEQSKRMGLVGGKCGYKFQIRNFNKYADMTFEVYRDGALALAASASLAVAALAF